MVSIVREPGGSPNNPIEILESRETPHQRIAYFAQNQLLLSAQAFIIEGPEFAYQVLKRKMRSFIAYLVVEVKSLPFRVHTLYIRLHLWVSTHPDTYALFEWFAGILIEDQNSSQKIEEAKHELLQKTRNTVYNETAKVLSHYIVKYCRHSLDNALTMHPSVCPEWAAQLTWKTPDGTLAYTLVGRLVCTYLERHEALIQCYIELNLLKCLSTFVDLIQKNQSEKRFAVLDVLKEFIASKVTPHFYECNAKARHLAQHPPSQQEQLLMQHEEMVLNGLYEQSFHVLADVFLKIFLPQDGKELELPMGMIAASYAQKYLFTLLKKSVLPDLLKTGFTLATNEYAKCVLLIEGFELIRKTVDDEYRPHVPELDNHYPHQKALEETLFDLFLEFFEYGDPEFIPARIATLSITKLAEPSAYRMGQKLQTMTLQEIVLLGLEKLLPMLNTNGCWVVENGQKRFALQPFQFDSTLEDKQAKERLYQQKTEEANGRLNELVDAIGINPQGIIQRTQSNLLGANRPVYVSPGSQASSLWTMYQNWTKPVASACVSFLGIAGRVRHLNRSLLAKMVLPEHHRLFIESAQSIVQLMGQYPQFPDLRDPRYKKSNQEQIE